MSRIHGVDPDTPDPLIQRVFQAQIKKWGQPLFNHLLYARIPPIFRGVRAMWGGIDQSGLIDAGLQTLLNRRVAYHNGCLF